MSSHGELICAIHQPNFFPRLSTVAKLYAADIWISLDDVQFVRRDYQHRCQVAGAGDARLPQRWLTIPVHLPAGRGTLIRDVQVAEAAASSDLRVRSSGRSERLADLASAVGATTYLCGTGGSRYLDPAPFKARKLRVVMFKPPKHPDGVTGHDVNRLTGLSDLAEVGPLALAAQLGEHARAWRETRASDLAG